MVISPQIALTLLEQYTYFLIFPITVFEGPIITVITGFLIFLGYLNPYAAYIIVVIADVVGDSMYYAIGANFRKLMWVRKYAKYVGYNEKSEAFLEEHFKKHTGKTLLIAKASHGVGAAVQISAGIAKMNFKLFLWYSIIGTMLKSFALLVLGYYLGEYYLKIDNYFHSVAIFTVVAVAVIAGSYVLIKKMANNYLNNPEK